MFDPSKESKSMDRLYKMTFQAPQNAGTIPLTIHFVSDSFVGEDVRRSVAVSLH